MRYVLLEKLSIGCSKRRMIVFVAVPPKAFLWNVDSRLPETKFIDKMSSLQ